MRYELSDFDRAAIKPFLLNKPRGIRRVNGGGLASGVRSWMRWQSVMMRRCR